MKKQYIENLPPMPHRRLLRGEAKNWFFSIICHIASSLASVLVGRYIFINFISPRAVMISVVIIFLCAQFIEGMPSPYTRSIIKFNIFGERPSC
jgi:hypothetical protein